MSPLGPSSCPFCPYLVLWEIQWAFLYIEQPRSVGLSPYLKALKAIHHIATRGSSLKTKGIILALQMLSDTVEGHAPPSLFPENNKKDPFNCDYLTDEHSSKGEAITADCLLNVGVNRESWQPLNHALHLRLPSSRVPPLCHHTISHAQPQAGEPTLSGTCSFSSRGAG